MAIKQFLNLQREEIDNDLEVIVDEIAKAYSIDNKTYETDKKDIVIFKIGYSKAIKALQKLCLYKK